MNDQLPILHDPPTPKDGAEVALLLCNHLSAKIGDATGFMPTVTDGWRRDMKNLIDRGPNGVKQSVEPRAIYDVINATFDGDGWWASKITSPKFLRKHYVRISAEAQNLIPKVDNDQMADAVRRLREL